MSRRSARERALGSIHFRGRFTSSSLGLLETIIEKRGDPIASTAIVFG
jgi:hypothetical protein